MSATAIKLVHRGKAIPERQSLWSFGGEAWEIKDKRAQRPYTSSTPIQQIASSQIQIFGKPLPGSGSIFKALANGKTYKIPFEVNGSGSDFYTFGVTPTPYYLISHCVCPRDDLDRTTVGVAEQVSLFWSPTPEGATYYSPVNEPITWTTTAGGLGSTTMWPTLFTAPSNETDTVTVTATVRDEKCSIDFKVIEPSGIKATKRSSESFSGVGAGMFIDVFLLPLDVSFYRLEVIEPAEATTGKEGYFTSHTPPTHAGNGADDPHPVNCDNKILSPPLNLFDHASSAGWTAPFGSGGRYT